MVDHASHPKPNDPRRQSSPDGAREEPSGDRVAKALARAGVASRREVERLIAEGRVALNGRVLSTPAVKVAPGDILTVNGEVVSDAEPTRVWRYHKPVGLVTTHSDPKGRPTVFQNLPEGLPRVISVGRLDLNSEGLLLLTNDGGLARALELPGAGVIRRYRARAYGQTDQARLDRLKAGVVVEGVAYGSIEASLDKVRRSSGSDLKGPANLWITLTLAEGKNREVRRVLESIGLKVNRLIRLSYGPFALGVLPLGAAEEVGPRVVRELLADHIAPQNLPQGDRTPGVLKPLHDGGLRRARSPAPKAGEAEAERVRKAQKPVYKQGWAKPKKRPAAAPKTPRARSAKPARDLSGDPVAAEGADTGRRGTGARRREPRAPAAGPRPRR
jgi:23S rRNA pseudouridine2605 synthase